jgi:ribokinase
VKSLPAPFDITAAGETFYGALVVAIGQVITEAVGFASKAATISVTRLGAQASVPSLAEVKSL